MLSEAERRYSMDQALADARLEGYEPDAGFLELAARVVRNELTHEQAIAIIREKALAKDRAARGV